MKRHLITLMLLVLSTLMVRAQHTVLNGDLNHDGRISVEDIIMMNGVIQGTAFGEKISSTEKLAYGVTPGGNTAVLLDGQSFSAAIRKLANGGNNTLQEDNNVRKITFRKGSSAQNNPVQVCSEVSPRPACATYNSETGEVDIFVDATQLLFPESCSAMFKNFYALTEIDWSAFDTNIDTRNVTDMSSMFSGCLALTSLNLASFNTSSVTDMSSMFNECSALTSLNVTHFDTSKVTDMSYMFNECSALTSLDVTNFDTGCVTDMSYMFENCASLDVLDVSSFFTLSVKNMESMFQGCYGLDVLDVSSFNTSSVRNMSNMFTGCFNLTALKLSYNFTIANACNTAFMLLATANNLDARFQKCTITCSSATQTKLKDPVTEIDKS